MNKGGTKLPKKKETLKTQEHAMPEEVDVKATETEEHSEAVAAETLDTEVSTEEEQEPVDEIQELREQLEVEQNKYLRLLADYDNFKRRTQKDKELANKFRAQSLLTDILPVLDNFERALSVPTKSEESASLLKGLEMVQKSLVEAVNREGLEKINALGEPFDPNFHQAVMQEKDGNAEAGTVLQELQTGYILKDRVLRPVMVKVNE